MALKSSAMACVVGLLCCAAVPVSAQERSPERRVSPGAFWSANFASVSLAPEVDGVKGRQWVGGGLSLEVPLGRVWSLDGRAYWNRRGARLPIAGTGGYQDVSADYISIPLLLKAARPGTVRPYALGGAELGVRIRARVRTVVGAVDAEEDAQDLIRRTDVSLAGGAGIERALGKSTVFVEGLYSHGLRNVTPDASGDTTRTRTVTLLAGLRF